LFRASERKRALAENPILSHFFRKSLDTILKRPVKRRSNWLLPEGGKREEIVYEASDLLYHLLVLLYYDIDPGRIYWRCAVVLGSPALRKRSREDPERLFIWNSW
jgi:phosphoribosyl-ATP pyrophosphohydrolase